jgi:hypothetical protein
MPLPSENVHKIDPLTDAQRTVESRPNTDETSDKAIHDAQKSITSELIKHGKVKLDEWGTDLDIINCLGKDRFTFVSDITKSGTYVVKPCELTTAAMKEIIEAGLNSNISDLELLVPVYLKRHWRLAKLIFKNNLLAEAILWDSLTFENITSACEALQGAVKTAALPIVSSKVKQAEAIQVKVVATGIQTNSHSCMDYVVHQVSKSLSLDNAITSAINANALRVAVVKQIAVNVPALGKEFAKNLEIEGDFIQEKIELTAEQEKFLQKISQGGAVQVSFDDEFAQQIQKLQTSICNESKLQKIAFKRAYSIFKQKKPDQVIRVLEAPSSLKP